MRTSATLILLACLACAHPSPTTVSPAPAPPPAGSTTGECHAETALVNAVFWVQQAAEYRANALQAYAAARRALDAALADPTWVGALEDTPTTPTQPPAIILDLDETALDNTPFEARVIRRGQPYDEATWDAWVNEAAARAVPGAGEFLIYAKSRGVTPFYVTNRASRARAGTLRNLEKLGFPLGTPDGQTNLLLRGDRPEWETSDKTPRREWVAASYRVLMLFGDDLNDFANARDIGAAARAALVDRMASWWGSRWFVIPNPIYGSFERPVTAGTTDPCAQLREKINALRER